MGYVNTVESTNEKNPTYPRRLRSSFPTVPQPSAQPVRTFAPGPSEVDLLSLPRSLRIGSETEGDSESIRKTSGAEGSLGKEAGETQRRIFQPGATDGYWRAEAARPKSSVGEFQGGWRSVWSRNVSDSLGQSNVTRLPSVFLLRVACIPRSRDALREVVVKAM